MRNRETRCKSAERFGGPLRGRYTRGHGSYELLRNEPYLVYRNKNVIKTLIALDSLKFEYEILKDRVLLIFSENYQINLVHEELLRFYETPEIIHYGRQKQFQILDKYWVNSFNGFSTESLLNSDSEVSAICNEANVEEASRNVVEEQAVLKYTQNQEEVEILFADTFVSFECTKRDTEIEPSDLRLMIEKEEQKQFVPIVNEEEEVNIVLSEPIFVASPSYLDYFASTFELFANSLGFREIMTRSKQALTDTMQQAIAERNIQALFGTICSQNEKFKLKEEFFANEVVESILHQCYSENIQITEKVECSICKYNKQIVQYVDFLDLLIPTNENYLDIDFLIYKILSRHKTDSLCPECEAELYSSKEITDTRQVVFVKLNRFLDEKKNCTNVYFKDTLILSINDQLKELYFESAIIHHDLMYNGKYCTLTKTNQQWYEINEFGWSETKNNKYDDKILWLTYDLRDVENK